jgi:hypothetical protein
LGDRKTQNVVQQIGDDNHWIGDCRVIRAVMFSMTEKLELFIENEEHELLTGHSY